MSHNEKKSKSLFGLFHKAPAASSAAEMLNAARAKAEAEAAAEEAAPVTVVTSARKAYDYISSWQRTEDVDEQEREVVVNASGVASKLQEILTAPDTEPEQHAAEPRCLSADAGEKFRQALSPLSPEMAVDAAPTSAALPRFSERLKQHIEGSLPSSFPTPHTVGTE